MGKILALDFGTKRVGVAISDEDHSIAFSRETIEAEPRQKLIQYLVALIKHDAVERVVVGVPLSRENEETPLSTAARTFGKQLGEKSGIPIVYIDEFGSSDEALSNIGSRKKRRNKKTKDACAAQIILERYLL